MNEYKYFKEEEFKRATPACSLSDMDEDFMLLIDKAREIAGVPFIINSAYRPVAYEKLHGRTGNSIHCQGKALDIRCLTNDMRFRILSALVSIGFRRIGIGSNFIHVDSGYPNAVNSIIWLYE